MGSGNAGSTKKTDGKEPGTQIRQWLLAGASIQSVVE